MTSMFGRGKKILESGQKAKAVVLEADMSGRTNRHAERLWKVKLRVQFDDGSTAEADCSMWTKPFDGPAAGAILSVRYDPDDRSKVEVDVAAMNVGHDAAREELEANLIEEAEQKLSRGEG
jgi:phage baseplate assembly protein gpV